MAKLSPKKDIPQTSPPAEPPQLQLYDIPVEGSLALLAIGARGLLAWREKRAEAKEREANQDG